MNNMLYLGDWSTATPFGQALRALIRLTFDDLRSDLGRDACEKLVSPFGHPMQVCTAVQLVAICDRLRVPLATQINNQFRITGVQICANIKDRLWQPGLFTVPNFSVMS